MNQQEQYAELTRPLWAPPVWLFGPVWTALYIVIAITFGYVFYKAIKKDFPMSIVLPFVLNLVFNAVYTFIQFGLRNNVLASIDVILVLITLAWALRGLWRANAGMRWVVYANIPYLLWCCFATALQLSITWLNA